MRNATFITSSMFMTLVMIALWLYWAFFSWGTFNGFLLLFFSWSLTCTFIAWRHLASHKDVKFFNTYFRSVAVTVIIFLGLCLLDLWQHGSMYRQYGVSFIRAEERLEMLGWAGLLTSFLIGTFSATSTKPWSWLRVSLLILLGWLSAFCIDISFFELSR